MEVQTLNLKKIKSLNFSDDQLKVEIIPLEKGLSFWHRNKIKLRKQYKKKNKLRFTDYFLLKKYPELPGFSEVWKNHRKVTYEYYRNNYLQIPNPGETHSGEAEKYKS